MLHVPLGENSIIRNGPKQVFVRPQKIIGGRAVSVKFSKRQEWPSEIPNVKSWIIMIVGYCHLSALPLVGGRFCRPTYRSPPDVSDGMRRAKLQHRLLSSVVTLEIPDPDELVKSS